MSTFPITVTRADIFADGGKKTKKRKANQPKTRRGKGISGGEVEEWPVETPVEGETEAKQGVEDGYAELGLPSGFGSSKKSNRKRRDRSKGHTATADGAIGVGDGEMHDTTLLHGDGGSGGSSFAPVTVDVSKYWYKRHILWSKYDAGILMDDEGWYSVTPEAVAAHIAAKPTWKGNVIVDAFCGYGGNTIQFALHNPECVVIGIDNALDHIEMAKHNARIYGVQHRIEFVCGDVSDVLGGIGRCCGVGFASKLFLAPPWGGPDYSKQPVYSLSQLPLEGGAVRLMAVASTVCRDVALFLPKNTDRDELASLRQPHHNSVEIEELVLNGRLLGIVVYYHQNSEASESVK